MAHKKCPECKEQVSVKANVCPHCGFPIVPESSSFTSTMSGGQEKENDAISIWVKEQEAFTKKIISKLKSHPDLMSKVSQVKISVPNSLGSESFLECDVCHIYRVPFCSAPEVDPSTTLQSHYRSQKDILNQRGVLSDHAHRPIIELIQGLRKNTVIVIDSNSDYRGIFDHLSAYLGLKREYYYQHYFGYLPLYLPKIKKNSHIVILSLNGSTEYFEEFCKQVLEKCFEKMVCVSYMSFYGEITPEEAVPFLLAEERAKQKANRISLAVSSWEKIPRSSIPHVYLLRYYPMTSEIDATEREWHDRHIIWAFKNDPDKRPRMSYSQALEEIVPTITEKLTSCFGDLLPEFTFVCIPASTAEKNKSRYEIFSDSICKETNMQNAYSHISVILDRLAKHNRIIKLSGSNPISPFNVEFDKDYFRGRKIILFDDILTTGASMRLYAERLSLLGAKVIGAITIGKTFHTRPITESEK